MASIPITLVGKSFTDPAGNTTFVGEAFSPGLQVGGGPMPGGPGLGFWGGSLGPYPDQGLPGPQPGGPIGLWGPITYPDQGLPGQPPRPWGPINYPDQSLPLPQPPFPPPGGAGAGQWRWVYSLRFGWVLDPGEGGKPQPPGGAGQPPGQPPTLPQPPRTDVGPSHPIQPTTPEPKTK